MAADAKVIDAEFIEPEPKTTPRPESVVEATIFTARTVAGSLEQAGFKNAADKAQTVASVAESARDTYHAIQPGISALKRFVKKLEDMKLITYAERPPLRRVP